MGRLVYPMSVSLDGFVATRDGDISWSAPDEELMRLFNEEARNTAVFLYGRRVYELMTAFWPTAAENPSASLADVEYARIWRDKPKVVFSRTLRSVAWNSRLSGDDAAAEIAALKRDVEGDISVGGPGLAATFARLGLIDEYRLVVRPVVLGGGTPFFPPMERRINLRLIEQRTFDGGVVFLRYEHAGD